MKIKTRLIWKESVIAVVGSHSQRLTQQKNRIFIAFIGQPFARMLNIDDSSEPNDRPLFGRNSGRIKSVFTGMSESDI